MVEPDALVLISPFVPLTSSLPSQMPTLPLLLLSPPISMVSDLSCATFTASVNSLPAATLVIWRLMSLLPEPKPTETAPILLPSTFSVDLKPLATVASVVTE
ncbi:hypothetical protein SVR5_00453 [Glaesserella parasuis 29755]|nr:hypothetical protein SVR5_00453 [Glaesserella parasuis 29755]